MTMHHEPPQASDIATRAGLKGYTQAAYVSDGMSDLEGYINPSDDLDGSFIMICGLTGDRLRIQGWLASEITFVDELD